MATKEYVERERYTQFYEIKNDQLKYWCQANPYCFRITPGSRDNIGIGGDFYLPISPQNLTIKTHFATNFIATAYGTVEEHSEQRYFDIVIAGTTGMAPKYYDMNVDGNNKPSPINALDKWLKSVKDAASSALGHNIATDAAGRSSFRVNKIQTGGFFNRTKALLENTLNKAVSIFGGSSDYESGVNYDKTGYIAFHNFYRFLLSYKKDIISKDNTKRWDSKNHPLKFVNFKDNNMYNVMIHTFDLIRSVDDPMLYKYNIVMKAYALSGLQEPSPLVSRLEDLGLNSVDSASLKAQLSNKVRAAKNAAFSVIAAAKGFGS